MSKTEWRVVEWEHGGGYAVVYSDGTTIREIARGLDKPTAHRIAAVNELETALKTAELRIRDLADWYVSNPEHNVSYAAGIELDRREIRAALAKAGGGQ